MALSSGQNMVNMGSGNNSGLGLNPASDEFKYLFTKKKVDLMNRDPYGTQLGDPKTELDKAWANFKSVNDELKAKGYNYNEAKDGAFGTVIKFDEKTSPKSDWPLKTINGPNGNIGELGAYKPGTMEFADPRMDVNSPKYDKDLADLYKKSSNTYLGGRLGLASNTLLASEELKTIADGLIANGVDVVKLEKDNPNFQLSSVAMSPSQLEDYNAWANSPAGRTTLERASEIANQQNNNLLSGANNNTGPNSPSAVSSPSTVAENEAALKTAWADFKSVNDELKAKGYSYLEAKDGMYGTAVSLRGSYYDYLNKVEGPKGDINNIYGATAEGVIVNPIGNPTSPQFDKSLSDLKNKFNQNGPHIIASASSGLAQAQSFEDLEAKLVAKGVDLVKLEQDNPYSAGFGDNQQTTFGAKAPTGQTNLPQTVGTQNENDILAMGGQAGRRIVGDKGTRRGGGTGVSPMQANTASSSTVAPYVIDPIQAQTNAMNAGTWKPSDGYYFSSPNGIGFDPTGKVKDIIDSHPLMSGNNSPEPDNQKALKDAGYSYMTGLGNDTMVVGPKGPYNVGWTSDPAKKGDYQKDLEKIWESSGVSFSQQTPQSASLASAPTAVSLSADTPQLPAVPNAFIATGVQPPQQPASGTGFDPSTISIVTNANSGAVLPQNQTVKPILIPDKNGNLVPASTTKGGSIGAPGSTASPYAQTTVPSFATKDTYTQKSPRQYP